MALINPLDRLEQLMSLPIASRKDALATSGASIIPDDTRKLVKQSGQMVDVEAELEAILNTNELVAQDFFVDDSDLPVAANFLEFCVSTKFMGVKPYLEQALIGLRLFAEICPKCSDMDWIHPDNHVPADGLEALARKVVCLEHGICPKCGSQRAQMIRSRLLNLYNELVAAVGQRAGKSFMTCLFCAYITHRQLKLQRPQTLYGLPLAQPLHGTFVALTKGQAKDNMWDPYFNLVHESPWFREYHSMLGHFSKLRGMELLKDNDTFTLYRHRNLFLYPAAPDMRILRGRTRMFAAIDEFAYFDTAQEATRGGKTKVRINGDEVYKALNNSLMSVRSRDRQLANAGFNQLMTGYMFNISSPRSMRDNIMNMLRISEGSTKMLGLHLPTWRVNPELPEDSELFKEESRKDHQAMMTNYGAQPPVVGNPFFNVPDRVIKSQRSKGYNYVKHRPYNFKVAKGISERSSEIVSIKECGYASVAAIDAGYSDNSFALAVGAMKDDGIVHVDLLVEVQPMPNVVLNYTRIFDEMLIPVCRARNVRVLLADQWQSIKLLQDARDILELAAADRHSLKYSDMVDAKNAINSGSMLIPKARTEIKTLKDLLAYDDSDYPACFAGNEVEHLLLQMCTVQDTGRAVLKGDGITDDLWRAVALLHWGATEDKYAEFLTKEEEVQEQVRPQFKAAMATGSKSRTFNGSIQQGKFIAVKTARK